MQPGTWNESFNWTHEEFDNAIEQAFVIEKRSSVCLDVEHSNRRNMDDIIRWAKEAGYNAEEKNMDTIRIWKDEPKEG